MNHPCPIKSNCLPGSQFLGQDTPFANLSSEAPDVDLFLGSNFGWDLNVPRLGWTFTDTDGPAWCRGTTQANADLCAQNQQLTGGGSNPGMLKTWLTQNGTPPSVFFNTFQQCAFTCPDGLLFIFGVLAGQFFALDQNTANVMAQEFACKQALALHICLGSITNTATVGVAYSSTATFTAANFPIGAQVFSGSLPPGLLLSQDPQGKSFTISGTPTTAGTFNFTILASDPFGNFMQKAYTITVNSNCPSFWNTLLPLWTPSTIGPGSQAFIIGNTVTLLADAPALALGFAQLQAIAAAPLAQALTCSITATLIQNTNPPPQINQTLALVVKDFNSNTFFLNFNVTGNGFPIQQTFQFTIPKGITPLISFAILDTGNGGPDSILQYTVVVDG